MAQKKKSVIWTVVGTTIAAVLMALASLTDAGTKLITLFRGESKSASSSIVGNQNNQGDASTTNGVAIGAGSRNNVVTINPPLAANTSKPPVETISVQCNFGTMPNVMPASGRIYTWQMNAIPQDSGGGGIGHTYGRPGAEMKWTNGQFPIEAFECQIINNLEEPISNVFIFPTMTYIEAIKDTPTHTRSGKVTLSREWLLNFDRIDPGRGNSFPFYIINMTPHFAQIALPDAGSYESIRGGRRNVRIIKPIGMLGSLSPRSEN